MMEEWVARRIDSPHVLKPCLPSRKRNFLYVVTEYIDGQTLTQWMIDNPKPELETVRGIVEQIAKGLRAFHRKEMLHQDLRPDNIMIDKTGTVKIIDFGSTRITGVVEAAPSGHRDDILGTAQYTAPEYFLGETVVAFRPVFARRHHLPDADREIALWRGSGAKRGRGRNSTSWSTARRSHRDREIPAWIDGTLEQGGASQSLQALRRLSEFLYDLRHPNAKYLNDVIDAADRAQSAAVLEDHDDRAGARGDVLLAMMHGMRH